MTPVERITAALAEREAMLDAATTKHGPWTTEPDTGAGLVWVQAAPRWKWRDLEPIFKVRTDKEYAQRATDAALIVAAVNQQRALIAHARDVLSRHRKIDNFEAVGICVTCRTASGSYVAAADCPESASLLAAWCGP